MSSLGSSGEDRAHITRKLCQLLDTYVTNLYEMAVLIDTKFIKVVRDGWNKFFFS